MQLKFKKVVIYGVFLALILGYDFISSNGLPVGKSPQFKQITLDGEVANEYFGNGPAIIYFWAKWCGICRMMQAPISEVLNDFPGVTIAIKSGSSAKVEAYLMSNMLNWKVVNDPMGRVSEQYKIQNVPSIFFLNGNGEIKLTTVGYVSEIGLRVRLWLVEII